MPVALVALLASSLSTVATDPSEPAGGLSVRLSGGHRIPIALEPRFDVEGDLRRAILSGDANRVRALVRDAPQLLHATLDPSGLYSARGTALHIAVDRDLAPIAALLLELGAAVGSRDGAGRTPLHRVRSATMVDLLIAHGADPHALDERGGTPIETFPRHVYATGRDIARTLAAHGATVGIVERAMFGIGPPIDRAAIRAATPSDRARALSAAARGGDLSLTRRLLRGGARAGHRLLSDVVDEGHWHVAALLIRERPTLLTDDAAWSCASGVSPDIDLLHRAIDAGATDAIEAIWNVPSTSDAGVREQSALVRAAWHGRVEAIEHLIDLGAAIDEPWEGTTALLAAAAGGHRKACVALHGRGVAASVHSLAALGETDALLDQLDRAPWLIDQRDTRLARTPLAWAVQFGHVDTVEALVRAGAPLDQTEPSARLHPVRWNPAVQAAPPSLAGLRGRADSIRGSLVALAAHVGHLEIAALLIDAGAPIDATALEELCRVPDVTATALLREALSQPTAQRVRRGWAFGALTRLLVERDLDPSERYARLELLLDAGAAVDLVDDAGESILQVTARRSAEGGFDRGVALRLAQLGAPIDLDVAIALGLDDHVAGILASEPVDHRSARAALARAARMDRVDMVRAIDRYLGGPPRARMRKTALNAAFHGATQTVAFAVERGALDLEVDGVELLLRAANAADPTLARWLIERGVDPTGTARNGETALHHACKFWSSHASVATLLELGADANARDDRGETPLVELLSARVGPGVAEIARALLEAGADPLAVGYGGKSAFDLASTVDAQPELRAELLDAFRDFVAPELFDE